MKLNREQIVKALECCIKVGGYRMDEHYCANCPLFDTRCALLLPQNALSLINELTVELDAMRCAANSYKMHYEKLTEENERLRAEQTKIKRKVLMEASSKFAGHSDYHGDTILCKLICMAEGKEVRVATPIDDVRRKETRADTVRKMQERLKANRVRRDGLSFKVVDFEAIDRVAAEMLVGE